MNCRYCGKETADKDYCSFECRKAYLDLYDDRDKNHEYKKPLIILAFVISVPVFVLFGGPGVTLLCLIIGATIITHPFPSKKMKEKMTVKKAVHMMKITGVVIILIGLPFVFFYWTPFFL